ncbi:hypothetical protein [Sphingobium yanoikuyae]|uniref:J domain-containing protein n=1 Tax=Sphingobium yanoikuyae TaxID=13690 RepID=A0A291MUJ7_SPHYA|nr:hypothetical protein [Sphingobium yanoikuyae]ATI78779.1 hypothetical protein A6768_01400 [Sphingobium yanoikuyae]
MSPSSAWHLLGIEATADSKTIRRAYAARLRAIDPDQDRDGFAALRDARDQALMLASGEVADAPPPGIMIDGMEVIVPSPDMAFSGALPATCDIASAPLSIAAATPSADWRMPPIAPDCRIAADGGDAIALPLPDGADALIVPTVTRAEVQDLSRADHALHALLYPDPDAQSQDRPLHPADIVNGTTLISRIHAEAQQGAIDLHARVDDWLANILAGSWPRAQPLLAPAARLFGWDALEGQIDAPPAVDFINRRLASDRFAQQVQQKGHPLHRAWQQLAKPTRPGQGRALWWQGAKIDELLGTIRRDHPEIESRLNWHRIALWEDHSARPIRWWTVAFGIFFALQLIVRIATSIYNPAENSSRISLEQPVPAMPVATAPRVPGGLGDVAADMQAAVRAAFGKDIPLDLLNAQAPLVHALFASNWRAGMGMGWTRARYVEAMTGIIRNRYALLARQKGGDSLIAMQRQRLKEERALKGDHWHACAEAAKHGAFADPELIPADLREPARAQVADLVVAMPDNPVLPPPGGSFSIPGQIVQRVIDQSGLSLDQVSAAFQNKGKDREQCLTHIALLDAALDANKATRAALLPHI